MKAILCSQYCQPDDLVLADVPDPVAEPGQAVIAIKSAALNFFDILMIQGKYQIKPPRSATAWWRPAAITVRAKRSRCRRTRS
jgi:NADPH:quinone reductase-like Zn-dependent oxidoreductase